MKSKDRLCACWSKIKPQNGGLKFFFKTKFFKVKPQQAREIKAELFW